jgi:hypothetical protein
MVATWKKLILAADATAITMCLAFSIPDALTTGQKKQRLLAPCAMTILYVRLVITTAPTGANLVVDIMKGAGAGTSIYTTTANRPYIAAGSYQDDHQHVPDTASVAAGDEFSVNIIQIGSTIAGSDLTIEVVGTQQVTL